MRDLRISLFRVAAAMLLVVLVLLGLGMATHVLRMPGSAAAEQSALPEKPELAGVELVKGMPHALRVPEEVRRSLGILKGNVEMIAVASKPVRTRPLVMPGSTALDPAKIVRVRVRFTPADVVRMGQIHDPHSSPGSTPAESQRDLQSGDRVTSGQLIAELFSVDVGNKKNDLFDALSQLRLDQELLDRAVAKTAAVPEVFILNARRNVEADINAVKRAENILQTWQIPEEDIQAVRDEAKTIDVLKKHDRDDQRIQQWARVKLKSPVDGVLIEQNVSLHETVVDNTTNLFQIAQVDPLVVFANVPEDDLPELQDLLPELQDLKSDTRNWIDWTVTTVGSKPIPGYVDDIGYLIDPSQHTAVVKGHIPNRHGVLRAGQFVTTTVELRAPKNVVEVPISALVEDGTQSIVFVQSDPAKPIYTMRRVQVTARFDHTAYVRSSEVPKDEQLAPEEVAEHLPPKQPLHLGERVLEAGALELRGALSDKESEPEKREAPSAKEKG
jgi:membrane fusion protein, heavy metal efflux system